MSTLPLTDEQCIEAVEAVARHHGSVKRAAAELDINYFTFKHHLKKAAERGFCKTAPVMPGFRIARVSTTEGADGAIKSRSIIQKPDMDEAAFSMPHGHRIKGVSALVDGNGEVVQQWFKTGLAGIDPLSMTDAIKEAFADWTPPAFPNVPLPDANDDLLTIYPIADAHLGLRAVADESGADYNLDIAAERFRQTTARLFDRSPNSGTALILQLGDWTHADDELAMTPSSKHILQVSDRQFPTVVAGVQLMIDYIYHALRKHKLVIVKVLKGNHDLNAWISLYVGISQHFRDNPRVKVDGGAADYWFFRWGMTLIGAHHGHRMKPAQMAGAMATECREDWGETLYRIFLHGHLHHMRVEEVLGVRVECFRTLAEPDQHHSGKYGSGKSLISINVHREDGEDGRGIINIPPIKKRAITEAMA